MATEWDDLTYNIRVLLDDREQYDDDEIKGMLRCMLHDLFSVAANNLHPTEKNVKRLDDLLIKHTGESHLHTSKTYQLEKALEGEKPKPVKKPTVVIRVVDDEEAECCICSDQAGYSVDFRGRNIEKTYCRQHLTDYQADSAYTTFLSRDVAAKKAWVNRDCACCGMKAEWDKFQNGVCVASYCNNHNWKETDWGT